MNNKEYINLCLYYRNEWNPMMKISETIIPWISEWIYYFEFWCITNGVVEESIQTKKLLKKTTRIEACRLFIFSNHSSNSS